MPSTDVVIIGGGLVGLAIAKALSEQYPSCTLAVLEKEPQVGAHQSRHNSGVIHSGLYYRPGSVKAKTCVAGAALMKRFCLEHAIRYEECGKLVVATHEAERPRLQALHARGLANGVAGIALVGPERLRELEPHARGIQALHVPGAAVVDYAQVSRALAELLQRRGAQVRTSTRVTQLRRQGGAWDIETTAGPLRAAQVITCGGLHADRLVRMAHGPADVRIAPFRGEYFEVVPARRSLVRSMIYPVPDPALPFLGVHFTRTIAGHVHAGPNAVLAMKREGYRKRDVSWQDTAELLGFPGFWRMARRYWTVGVAEWHRSLSKGAFVRALQRLVPAGRAEDLVPAESGVRAQALGRDGSLLDDFDIQQGEAAIYVRNVPSPAATASLAIGQTIAGMAAASWHLPATPSGAHKIA